METLKNLLLIIAGLFAFVIIAMSRDVPGDIIYDTAETIRYASYLVLALCFLHWALNAYLMPIKGLPAAEQQRLQDLVWKTHTGRSFGGFFGLAGICTLFYITKMFMAPERMDAPTSIYWASSLIVLGNIYNARTLSKILAQHRADTLKESGESVEGEVEEETQGQLGEVQGRV